MRLLLMAPLVLCAVGWLAARIFPGSIAVECDRCYFIAISGNNICIGVARQRQMILGGDGWAGTSPTEVAYSNAWRAHLRADMRALKPGIVIPAAGFFSHWGRYDPSGRPLIESGAAFTFPSWIAIAASVLVPWVWAVRRRLRSQGAASHFRCHECGYDLRATPKRCPECGAISQIGELKEI